MIIDGQKMSKSLGNFYTLRDLFAKGQKPSTIRFLLLSVPYRRQLNFTEDGLTQARNSVERLRNFVARLKTTQFPAGSNAETVKRIETAEIEFDAGLADDINTAVALAAVFDLVRDVNTAMDRGAFLQQDAVRALVAMEKFDAILSLLADDDDEKLAKLGFTPAKPRLRCRTGRRPDRRAQRRQAPPRLPARRRHSPAARRFWYHRGRYERRHGSLEVQMSFSAQHALSLHSMPSLDRPSLFGVD